MAEMASRACTRRRSEPRISWWRADSYATGSSSGENTKQAKDGFGVLDPAIVDHSEGFLLCCDLDFNDFIVVGICLCLDQVRRLVEVHEFGCKSRRRPETGAFHEIAREITGLLFEFPPRRFKRIFLRIQTARADFQQVSASSVAVLSDQNDIAVWEEWNYADRARMDDNLQVRAVACRIDDLVDANLNVTSFESDFAVNELRLCHLRFCEHLTERAHALVDLLGRNDERRQEPQARIVCTVDDEPAFEHLPDVVFPRHIQLNREHQANPADFLDDREILQCLQAAFEVSAVFTDLIEQLFFLKNLEVLET